jgi:hypothetical protein
MNWIVESLSGIRAVFPLAAIFGSLVILLLLAMGGALLSIRRATTVDPMMVFRA